jgi:hypothetical protein
VRIDDAPGQRTSPHPLPLPLPSPHAVCGGRGRGLNVQLLHTAADFANLQGVSTSYYGAPLCALIIDCGAADSGTSSALSLTLQLELFSSQAHLV